MSGVNGQTNVPVYRFLAEPVDLERLMSARRVCYLVGGYEGYANYGDVLQWVAAIQRVRALPGAVLPVSLIYAPNRTNHQRLCTHYAGLIDAAPCLYFEPPSLPSLPDGPLAEAPLFGLELAPPGEAQLLMYGGGFLTEWWRWGPQKLDLLDSLDLWLQAGRKGELPPLALSGQQVTGNIVTGPSGPRLRRLFDRAGYVGVRDRCSEATLRAAAPDLCAEKLHYTFDDALPLLGTLASRRSTDRDRSARSSSQQLIVNVHCSLANYVSDDAQQVLGAIAALLRQVDRRHGDAAGINLVVAYDDSQVSERAFAERLLKRAGPLKVHVQCLDLLEEAQAGFPVFGSANLTVSCSYHVALSSLSLGLPTALVLANDYYAQKAAGLAVEFDLPAEMMVDLRIGRPGRAARALARLVSDPALRHRAAVGAQRGVLALNGRTALAASILQRWLGDGYLARLERSERQLLAQLVDQAAQLADSRDDYLRLLRVSEAPRSRLGRAPGVQRGETDAYQRIVERVRDLVEEHVPSDATVLVVSRGDERLLELGGRRAWHFPRQADGAYAGYYPANGAAAVSHLVELRECGAEYVLFPATALWWLEHYRELAEYLRAEARLRIIREDAGVLVSFREPSGEAPTFEARSAYLAAVEHIREAACSALPLSATVLVISRGDDGLLNLRGRRAWHFPCQEDGSFAGYYPADDAAAIEHLEAQRAAGADHLLIPESAFWWLGYYWGFHEHLESRYRKSWSDEHCIVFALTPSYTRTGSEHWLGREREMPSADQR